MADFSAQETTGVLVNPSFAELDASPAWDDYLSFVPDFATLGGYGNQTAPLIENVTPTASSSILRTATISFDITDDEDLLQNAIVEAIYTTGNIEVVHDGSAFGAQFSGARVPITDGYSYSFSRDDAGWPTSTLTIRITAVDSAGNEGAPADYAYTVTNPLNPVEVVLDTADPVVTNFSPAVLSSITRTASISFDVTDDEALALIIVMAERGSGQVEVVHDGTNFVGVFAGSRTPISGGYTYTVSRGGYGWPEADLTLHVVSVDTSGNQSSPTTFGYTITNPLDPVEVVLDAVVPTVSNFAPPVLSTILRTDSIAFDVEDDSGSFGSIIVAAKRGSGRTEIVHDGTVFVDPYSGTRTPIANGFSYDIERGGYGWPEADLEIQVYAVDLGGNQSTPVGFDFTISDPIAPEEVATYYRMRGRDSICPVQPAYVYWTVTSEPDLDASELNPSELPCGSDPLLDVVDISIAFTWRA